MTNLEALAHGYWCACLVLRAPAASDDQRDSAENVILKLLDADVPEYLRTLAQREHTRQLGLAVFPMVKS